MFIWAPCDAFGTALRGGFAVTVRGGFAAAFRGAFAVTVRGWFAAAFRGGFAAVLRGGFAAALRGGGGFTDAFVLSPAEERRCRSTGEMSSGLQKSSENVRKYNFYVAELF